MAGNMQYNFAAVDTHSLTFASICNSIDANNTDLAGMNTQLLHAFTGSGAEAWQQQVGILMRKLQDYQAAITRLRAVVQTVGGAGGAMDVTDKDQGGRFLAVNI